MAGYLSGLTTTLGNVQVGSVSNSNSAGFGTLSVNSFVDLFSTGAVLSMVTKADASGMTKGQLRIVFAASGISLVYSSGASTYIIGGSATSGAQA